MKLHERPEYLDLERRFREQVVRDRAHTIERVIQGWGVYLPCLEPKSQVDYILVGMEPSFSFADNIERAEQKIANGKRNYGYPCCPKDPKQPVDLFKWSIKRYLCQPGESFHLTDVSKGAMPVTVAALDRERRFKEWYPLLLEEICIVGKPGKPGKPIIAVGRKVEQFLRKMKLEDQTGRPLHYVPHYSRQAAMHVKEEANKSDGFEIFKACGFREDNWPEDLTETQKALVFVYKKRFEEIQRKVMDLNGGRPADQ